MLNDPTPSNPTYAWWLSDGGSANAFSPDCFYVYPYGNYCQYKTLFVVEYDKINCCSPSCVHGGSCTSNANCSCVDGTLGDMCEMGMRQLYYSKTNVQWMNVYMIRYLVLHFKGQLQLV